MTKIRVLIKGKSILKREARIEYYDRDGKNILSKFYAFFKRGSDISDELTLSPGIYSLAYRINAGERDIDYEVALLADLKTDLNAPINPKPEQTFGNIGVGQMPFFIV